jgi:hypothetical protein
MATAAEQSARKKRKEEEAERRRLKELGILPEGVVPGQERGIAPPSNIDEIAASEAPYDDGYVEPDPSDFVNPLTESGTDPAVLPTEEEIEDRHSKAKSDALAEGRKEFYDLTGETVEGAKFDMPGAAEKRKEEDALDQQTFEEGREKYKQETQDIIAQDQADHEERLKNPSHPAYENPKDARVREAAEEANRNVDLRGEGVSRAQQTANESTVLQKYREEQAAKEAKIADDKRRGVVSKGIMDDPDMIATQERLNEENDDRNRALLLAGHEPGGDSIPVTQTTEGKVGGGLYKKSLKDRIEVKDKDGNVTRVIFRDIPGARDKQRASEEAQGKVRMKFGEKVAADEASSANDTFVSQTQSDKQVAARERRIREAAEQKTERKRRGMLLRGDTHALGELDRQTAEDAATRLRDAEAAIRAREDLTANEQAIAIQELKNAGATGVAQIGADAQTDVATTQAGATMHGADADVEIAAGQNQSAETINKNTTDAAQTQLETKVTADETAAANLAVTNAAAAQAQADVNTAAVAVENAQTTKEREGAEAHLQLMQDNLLDAQTADAKAEREAKEASEKRRIAEEQRSQKAREAHEALMQTEEYKVAREAMNNQNDDKARQDAIDKNNREIADLEMAIASGTLDGAQQAEAEAEIAAKRGIAPSTSLNPEHAEVSLERTNPEVLSEVLNLTGKYIEDSDGGSWIGDNWWEAVASGFGQLGEYRPGDTENLKFFAQHLQTMVDQKKITPENIKMVSAIILGKMHGDVKKALMALPMVNPGDQTRMSEEFRVIMPILQGQMPIARH